MGEISVRKRVPRDMNRLLFWRLKTEQGTKVLIDGSIDYYHLFINGYTLLYAKNRYRPDALRLYILDDQLARVLGFSSYEEMRYRVKMQYSRKMLSVEAIQRHFEGKKEPRNKVKGQFIHK